MKDKLAVNKVRVPSESIVNGEMVFTKTFAPYSQLQNSSDLQNLLELIVNKSGVTGVS
jgi:hypothetical protein